MYSLTDYAKIVAVAVVVVIVALILIVPHTFLTRAEVTGTVTDKYIKRYGDADHFFVALTAKDGNIEVIEDTDNWLWLKFNSADVYQQVTVGKTYTLTVVGWRIPLFSWFRDIMGVQPMAQ